MDMERFRKISKVISIVLKMMAVLLVIIILFLVAGLLYKENNFEFTYEPPTFGFFAQRAVYIDGPNGLGQMVRAEKMGAFIVTPLVALTEIYILFRGSSVFQYLADGYAPFAEKFAKRIKHLSIVLMVTDVLIPVLYSLLVTIFQKGGYSVSVGITSYFFFGLILYLVSEIFNYGIELQQLANETV